MANTIYRAIVRQQLNDQLVMNVMHFKAVGATDTAQDLAQHIDAFITASWASRVCQALKFNSIEVVPIVPYGASAFGMPCTTLSGTAALAAMPGNVALVLTLKTAKLGRSFQGRIYVAGTATIAYEFGVVSNGALPGYLGFAADLLAVFGENSTEDHYQLGVWSEKNGGQGAAAIPAGFTPVNQIRVNRVPATQRRRRVGVGA